MKFTQKRSHALSPSSSSARSPVDSYAGGSSLAPPPPFGALIYYTNLSGAELGRPGSVLLYSSHGRTLCALAS